MDISERERLIEENMAHLVYRGGSTTMHAVHVDEKYIYFYLYNLSGQLVGYQRYYKDGSKEYRNNDRDDAKYYTRITHGAKGSVLGVYGLHTYHPQSDLYLVEGVFDAIVLHRFGYSAIATLTNNPAHLKSWLSSLPNKIIAVPDGDKAGSKLSIYADTTVELPEGMDVNKMYTEDRMDELLKRIRNQHFEVC